MADRTAAYTAKAQEHVTAFFADGRKLPYDHTVGNVTARIHSVEIDAAGILVMVVGLFVGGREITCPDRAGPTRKCQIWKIVNAPTLVPDPSGTIERSYTDETGQAVVARYRKDPMAIQRAAMATDLIAPILRGR